MKNKKAKIIIIIIIALLVLSSATLYLFLNSKRLVFEYDKVKEVSLNTKITNLDNIKNIKNGKILTEEAIIDTSKVGNLKITIEVEDYFKKIHTYTYNINVIDIEKPIITFKEKIESEKGKKIDLLKDVTASDDSNEDIEVLVEGEYDINKPGDYKLYYVAKDKSGNTAKEEFTLTIKEKKITTQNEIRPDATFTTSKGFSGVTKDGVTYIDGYLIANKTYSIPSSYGSGLTKETTNAFYEMKSAASLDGLNIYISSGFRSYNSQRIIYNNYVKRDGVDVADTYSARPGHSEHQTGLAFDVNIINDSFAGTPEAIWLDKNAYKYGFILRYPKGKTNETGYKYEPWHFRYVGKNLALVLYNNGNWLTMEDYFGITSAY